MSELGPQDRPDDNYEMLQQRQLAAAQWFSYLVQYLAVHDMTEPEDEALGERLYGATYPFEDTGRIAVSYKTSDTGVYREESRVEIAYPWQVQDCEDGQRRRARLIKECSYLVDRPDAFSEELLRDVERALDVDEATRLSSDKLQHIQEMYLAYIGEMRLRRLEEGDMPPELVDMKSRAEVEVKLLQGPNYRSEYLATTSREAARAAHVRIVQALHAEATMSGLQSGQESVEKVLYQVISDGVPPEDPAARSEVY